MPKLRSYQPDRIYYVSHGTQYIIINNWGSTVHHSQLTLYYSIAGGYLNVLDLSEELRKLNLDVRICPS